MAPMIPYTPAASGTRREMVARTLTSVGTRATGRMPLFPASMLRASIPALPTRPRPSMHTGPMPYAAAKRMPLGALGLTPNEAFVGARTGYAAAGTATAVGTSIASAVGAGAAAGSVVPIIGTAIGAIVGLVASGVFDHKTDPEVGNFNQAVSMWQQNRLSVLNIADKYLVLAGLFDLEPGQIHGNIPIYKKYGRMGEQRFVSDMVSVIYNAAQAGKITAQDTPLTIMSRIVQPWIDSWGYGPMVDAHADMITLILIGMIIDYVTGNQTSWLARSGDYPFGNLPRFSIPAPAAPAPPPVIAAPAPTPAPVAQPSAAQTNPFRGWMNVGTVTDPRLIGQAWQEVENGYPNTWQPQAAGFFKTVWPNGASTIQMQISGSQVVGLRQDADGSWGTYNGMIGPDGVTITGTRVWYNNSAPSTSSSAWQATIPALPAAPIAAPVPLPAIPPMIPISAPLPAPAPAAPAAPAPMVHAQVITPAQAAATPPAGFTAVGQDATGNPIFANPQGVLYTWTGAGMQIFSGQLSGTSSLAAQMQTAIQNALAQGQSQQQAAQLALAQAQSQGVPVTPAIQQQVAAQTAVTAAAPAQAAPQTAGVSFAGTGGLLAVGAAVLLFVFATARPSSGRST